MIDFMTKDISLVSNQEIYSTETLSSKLLSGRTQILESYDGGMLILATVNWQIGESKLFKLDRLGGVLWEHTISDEEEGLVTIKMIDDEEGNIFLAGMCRLAEAICNSLYNVSLGNSSGSDCIQGEKAA